MAERKQIECDVCRIPKGQTNHWFRGRVANGEIKVSHLTGKRRKGDAELCGRAHLHKWIDGQLDAPAAGTVT